MVRDFSGVNYKLLPLLRFDNIRDIFRLIQRQS